jgi:transposase
MKEQVTLMQKEQQRLVTLNAVGRGQLTVSEAADVLGLSERQVRRLYAAYEEKGAAALIHGNRGRTPPNVLNARIRQQVIALAGGKYAGCNQVHLTELLAEREGITLSRSAVRRIMREAGMASPRTRRAPQHRKRRERYPRAGMLLQIDGSPHDWLEGRGPRLSLLAAIDDATGEVHGAVFREQEDAAGYLALVEQVVRTYGIPLAVYHDRHGIFGQLPLTQDPVGRRTEPTQVERALQELGIGSIAARSPQAKGRIERLFGTLQSRLVSELRLAGSSTRSEAEALLGPFLLCFNQRFGVPAQEPQSAYRVLPAELHLGQICCFKYTRTVAADNTVRLGEHRLQILPDRSRMSYTHAQVEVQERLDGSMAVYYRGECLATTEAPAEAPVLRARGGARVPEPSTTPRREQGPAAEPPEHPEPSSRPLRTSRKPAADHPWRSGYDRRAAGSSPGSGQNP